MNILKLLVLVLQVSAVIVKEIVAIENPYTIAIKKWKSIQDYVEVRPGAFIFYWLYYADGTPVDAAKKPLVIWIQGGPGLPATGVANFQEIGPFNLEMQPRNHTWIRGRNLLLIDHPVGTGFSYVTDKSLLVKSDRAIATDLSKTIKAFLRRHKEFRRTPTYIFGQSYGGKICPRLALYLHTAIEKKRLKMNFKGIGIGSGWVDPNESTLAQSTYLYDMGPNHYIRFDKPQILAREHRYFPRMLREAIEINKYPNFNRDDGWKVPPAWDPIIHKLKSHPGSHTAGTKDTGAIDLPTYLKIMTLAKRISKYIDKKNYFAAYKCNLEKFPIIGKESGMDISFNNINQVNSNRFEQEHILENVINSYVKPTLNMVNQSLRWSYYSHEVYETLSGNMFLPATRFLEILLNNTELNIAVYNGNLDVVTPLAGATNWVHKLQWHSAEQFKNAKRIPINGYRNGFYKKAKRFSFWWVFGSGHWVPEDNPTAMEQILNHVMTHEDLKN